jgi:hypothetical protein
MSESFEAGAWLRRLAGVVISCGALAVLGGCGGAEAEIGGGGGVVVPPGSGGAVEEPPFAFIAGGTSHTCVVDLNADVWCWGGNAQGQLGDGTRTASARPIQVEGIANVVAIAAGGDHSCALQNDGAIFCWGAGLQGQLGQGRLADSLEPVAVERLPGPAIGLAAGRTHTCALINDGSVRCWGSNAQGQLGRATSGAGSVQQSLVPLLIPGLPVGTVALGAGADHTCAARSVGAPRCWGANAQGQAGNGTTDAVSTVALVQGIPGNVNVLAVSGGVSHSCALTDDGDLFCWGSNGSGELGDGTVSAQPVTAAVKVQRNSDQVFTALGLGNQFSCALREQVIQKRGTAVCWGSNANGQLGQDIAAVPGSSVPLDVRTITPFDFISGAAGENHSCVLDDSDVIRCWGVNVDGQLGNGIPSAREDIPARVIGFQ